MVPIVILTTFIYIMWVCTCSRWCCIAGPSEVQEYCNSETFEASCAEGMVIVMQSALYGRMRLRRCVQTDFGFVGCSSDVLHLMDRRCSGQRTCSVRVADAMFEDASVCNVEFKSHLEAVYSCMPGNIHQL